MTKTVLRFGRKPIFFFYGTSLFFILASLTGCNAKSVRPVQEKASGAYYKFGLAYLYENPPKTQKAYVEFIKAIEADPNNEEAYYALGHLYFLQQEYGKAIEAFQKTVEIAPDFSAAFNYMGRALEMLGKEEEAILSYQNAMNNLRYETPQAPHWNLALLYKKQKRYGMALDELQQVRRIDPNNIAVMYEIGDTYIKQETPALARPIYEEAVRIEPNNHRTHYWLASFYLQEGLSLEAAHAFEKVIALSPESDEAKESMERLRSLTIVGPPNGVM